MKSKDWTGGNKSVFTTLAASSHSESEREQYDYYATDPKAVELLLKLEQPINKNIWECACGELHLSNVFKNHGFNVKSSDIISRCDGVEEYDFLSIDNIEWHKLSSPR